LLLALDSSTETMTLALSGPAAGQRRSVELGGGAQASELMVPQLQALLAEAGQRLADVDAIAFGQGPGAFTGLRTACAVAQGLAFGAGKPVLAIDSLMLVAEDARQQALADGEPEPAEIWVAMDARMDEIYAAAYRWQSAAWVPQSAPALYRPGALLQRWAEAPPQALCGSALALFPALAACGQRRWPESRRRGSALAALAEQAWARGALLAPEQAQPVYVRDKVALTTAEREAARAAVPAAASDA
jgi:tRNA threonylcarbamoyladenosine biosynthesis protein TsaB